MPWAFSWWAGLFERLTTRPGAGLYIDMRKAPRGGPPAGGKISTFPDSFYLSRPLGG